MDYYCVEETMQVIFERAIPLSKVQNTDLREVCIGVLLAGSSGLTSIARWLQQYTQQDSRVQWLRRLFQARFMRQEYVYYPFVKQVLSNSSIQALHLIIDRTPLPDPDTNLLSVNLAFRKRSIPLVWHFMPNGMSNFTLQQSLLERCKPLLPANVPVMVHGDNEFGSVRMMQYLRYSNWDFCLGQSRKNYYRLSTDTAWQPLSSLPVTPQHAVYLNHIELTKDFAYGPLNLFAFYQPHYHHRQRRREIAYCATSLPSTPAARRIGHRRWSIECCFKDFKSSGWQLQLSQLTHPQRREGLLTVLSLTYLWATCLGRWLCKTSHRHLIDTKTQRHLSLFRIGWDWLVHCYTLDLPCPTLLTLYQ